jgi:DNA-binding MarR family transcriptional regulator
MTVPLKAALTCALKVFVIEVTRATEQATIEAIRLAFGSASTQADNAVARAGVPRHKSTPIDVAALLECIREHPGCNRALLCRSLGIHSTTVGRHLRKLAKSGAIRIEEDPPVRFGGRRRRTFFVAEHANGVRAELLVGPSEATA